ncbi:hypothetical protein [Secundilactobacillus collinoides]|uniref:hypothetical protein n=1 Tax=Secundilactobacillus collinoides TaxID=33960 RepID=UPI0006CF25E2|nr:hypothetical protein [Secundilactobacillus collinoides]
MTALKMKVTIDEKPVSFSAIHSAELERTIAVASDLLQLIESDTELSHKVAPQLKSMHKLLEEKDASLEDLKKCTCFPEIRHWHRKYVSPITSRNKLDESKI